MNSKSRPCDVLCRAALARGPLTRVRGKLGGAHWRFKERRLFNNTTVNRLVARGEAIIEGNTVRGVSNDQQLS